MRVANPPGRLPRPTLRSEQVDKAAKIKVIIAVVLLLVALGIIGWYMMGSGGGNAGGPTPDAPSAAPPAV